MRSPRIDKVVEGTAGGSRTLADLPSGISKDLSADLCDTGEVGQRGWCADLVGRAEELEVLGSALRGAGQGRPATVLVSGDAGVGKTRLVSEMCERARRDGALVAIGACVPTGSGGLPYGPVVGILRFLIRQLGKPPASDVLGRVASEVGLVESQPADPVDPSSNPPRGDELAKTRLFEYILGCVETVAERSVVVLVFEDLHWADSASAELVDYLTRNLAETRVLVVGTYRSDELDRQHPLRRLLAELSRCGGVTRLPLDGLDLDETARLLAGMLGHQPDWPLVEAVYARSGGNPFFAEELTATRNTSVLSPELQDVIMTRFVALSPEAQQALRVVATAGSTVDHRLLIAACGTGADSLEPGLAEAVEKHILVVDSGGSAYRFRHALHREAVYAALLPSERIRLHSQVAFALATKPDLSPASRGHAALELADHWWAAGEWAEALGASVTAAKAAVAMSTFPEALPHFEHALSAWDRVTDADRAGTDRLQLLEWASDVAYLAGAGQRSVDLAHAAIDILDVTGDPVRAGRAYTMLGRNAWAIGDSVAAFSAYRQAAALLPADTPSVELARAVCEEARGLMFMSRFRDAEARCDQAITIARAVGARAEEGHALNTLGCCRASMGRADEGISLVREALAIAEEVASPDDLNRAYANLSELLMVWGRLEEAAAVVAEAVGGEQLGGIAPTCALIGADALCRLGRWDQAEDLLSGLANLVGICGNSRELVRAPIALRRGNFVEANRLLETADSLTTGLSDVLIRARLHTVQAELALEQGRPGDAWNDVERALTLAAGTDDEQETPEMYAIAVRALADRLDEARARGRSADADKDRLVALGLVREADHLLAAAAARGVACPPRATAWASVARAEQSRLHEPDPGLWEMAADCWETASESYPVVYCRWRQAQALLQGRAGRGRAAAVVERAWRQSRRLGARPLQARIEDLATRARIPLGPNENGGPSNQSQMASDLGLTPREVEVLGQLAAGRTDREIAEALFISKKTASVHVSNLLRKLDVANRFEAAEVGQRHGLA